jgi:hypothetical protein
VTVCFALRQVSGFHIGPGSASISALDYRITRIALCELAL